MAHSFRAISVEPGRVISETFAVYRDNLGPLLGSALVVFAVVELLSLLLFEAGGGIVLALFAFSLAGHALYTGVVVKLVEDVRDGRRDSAVGDLFSAAAPAILSLVVSPSSTRWGLRSDSCSSLSRA